MEDRIEVLEKEVDAIKSELSVMRRDRRDATELDVRVARVEAELAALKVDVELLRKDVARIEAELKELKAEVVQIRMEMVKQNVALANCATKADLKALEANLKGWMLVIAISLLGTELAMFSYLRSMAPAIHASAQQSGSTVGVVK